MKLFISHINEESALALVLKKWIERSFDGTCEVFVSSDTDDIPPGSFWFTEIAKALEGAVGLIVLCSPTSLSRPWINFETGWGCAKSIPIIPICHFGQRKGSLPSPMSMFQALEIEDERFIDDLFAGLAPLLRFKGTARLDQGSMKDDLIAAVSSIMRKASARDATVEADLPIESVEILKLLQSNTGNALSERQIAELCKMDEREMRSFLDGLARMNFIDRAVSLGGPSTYALSPHGRSYLFRFESLRPD